MVSGPVFEEWDERRRAEFGSTYKVYNPFEQTSEERINAIGKVLQLDDGWEKEIGDLNSGNFIRGRENIYMINHPDYDFPKFVQFTNANPQGVVLGRADVKKIAGRFFKEWNTSQKNQGNKDNVITFKTLDDQPEEESNLSIAKVIPVYALDGSGTILSYTSEADLAEGKKNIEQFMHNRTPKQITVKQSNNQTKNIDREAHPVLEDNPHYKNLIEDVIPNIKDPDSKKEAEFNAKAIELAYIDDETTRNYIASEYIKNYYTDILLAGARPGFKSHNYDELKSFIIENMDSISNFEDLLTPGTKAYNKLVFEFYDKRNISDSDKEKIKTAKKTFKEDVALLFDDQTEYDRFHYKTYIDKGLGRGTEEKEDYQIINDGLEELTTAYSDGFFMDEFAIGAGDVTDKYRDEKIKLSPDLKKQLINDISIKDFDRLASGTMTLAEKEMLITKSEMNLLKKFYDKHEDDLEKMNNELRVIEDETLIYDNKKKELEEQINLFETEIEELDKERDDLTLKIQPLESELQTLQKDIEKLLSTRGEETWEDIRTTGSVKQEDEEIVRRINNLVVELENKYKVYEDNINKWNIANTKINQIYNSDKYKKLRDIEAVIESDRERVNKKINNFQKKAEIFAEREDELNKRIGYNAATQEFQNNFELTDAYLEWMNENNEEGFLNAAADAALSLGEEFLDLGLGWTVGFGGQIVSASEEHIFGVDPGEDSKYYTSLEKRRDALGNLTSFNMFKVAERRMVENPDFDPNQPESEENPRMVQERMGHMFSEATFRNLTKSIAELAAFTTGILLSARKGNIKGVNDAYKVLTTAKKTKGLAISSERIAKLEKKLDKYTSFHRKLNMTKFTMKALTHDMVEEGKDMGLTGGDEFIYGAAAASITALSQLVMPDYQQLSNFKGLISTTLKSLTSKQGKIKGVEQVVKNNVREIFEEELDHLANSGLRIALGLKDHVTFQDWTVHQDIIAGTIMLSGPMSTYGAVKDYKLRKAVIDGYVSGMGETVIQDMQHFQQMIQTKIDKMERLQKAGHSKYDERIKELRESLKQYDVGIRYARAVQHAVKNAPKNVDQETLDLMVQKQVLMASIDEMGPIEKSDAQKKIKELDEKIEGSNVYNDYVSDTEALKDNIKETYDGKNDATIEVVETDETGSAEEIEISLNEQLILKNEQIKEAENVYGPTNDPEIAKLRQQRNTILKKLNDINEVKKDVESEYKLENLKNKITKSYKDWYAKNIDRFTINAKKFNEFKEKYKDSKLSEEDLINIFTDEQMFEQFQNLNEAVIVDGSNRMSPKDAVKKYNDGASVINNNDAYTGFYSNGFITPADINGRRKVIINKNQALKSGYVTTGQHEFLHLALNASVKGNDEVRIALGKALIEAANDTKMKGGGEFRARMAKYKNPGEAGEEAMTIFSESLTRGDIDLNDGIVTKIKDAYRQWLQRTGRRDIRFDTNQDVLNFIKDYNKTFKSKKPNKAFKKAFREGIKGKLIDNAGIIVNNKTNSDFSKSLKSTFEKFPSFKNDFDNLTQKPGVVRKEKETNNEYGARLRKWGNKEDFRNSTEYWDGYMQILDHKALDLLIRQGVAGELGITTPDGMDVFVDKVKQKLLKRYENNFDPSMANGSLFGWLIGGSGDYTDSMLYRAKGDVIVDYKKQITTESFDKTKTTQEGDTFVDQIEGETDTRLKALEEEVIILGKEKTDKAKTERELALEGVRFLDAIKASPAIIKQIKEVVENVGLKDSDWKMLVGLDYKGVKNLITTVEKITRNGKKVNPTKAADVVATGKLFKVLDVIAKQVGVPAKKILANQNFTTTEREAAQDYINENAQEILDILPDQHTMSGKATGLTKLILNLGYKPGKRAEYSAGATAAGLDLWIKDPNFTVEKLKEAVGQDANNTKRDPLIRGLITQMAVGTAKSAIKEYALSDESSPLHAIALLDDGASQVYFSNSDQANRIGDIKTAAIESVNDLMLLQNADWKDIVRSVKDAKGKNMMPIDMGTEQGRMQFKSWMYQVSNTYLPKSFYTTSGNFDGTSKSIKNKKGETIRREHKANLPYLSNGEVKETLDQLPGVVFAKEDADITRLLKGPNPNETKKEKESRRRGLIKVIKALDQMIQDDKANIPYVAALMSSIPSNQSNWMRKGSMFEFTNTLNEANTKEHTQPASDLGKFLLNRMIEGNLDLHLDVAIESYFQGALPNSYDNKLSVKGEFSYKENAGKYTHDVLMLGKPIWIRYFNPDVNGNKGGINPNVIILSNGKSVAEEYGVGIDTKFQNDKSFVSMQQDLLFQVFNGDITQSEATKRMNDYVKKMSGISTDNDIRVSIMHSKAVNNTRRINHETISRGMSTFDFDETLIDKGENFITATKGDDIIKISSGQWPLQGPQLAKQGYDFNFDDFINVRGGIEGPLMQKFRNQIKKYGVDNIYILTARPAKSAPAIQAWLKEQNIDLPLKNITGLGNSTGEAKAEWMLEKFSEGYNDMYFVDDALPNVDAVKNVLDQLDIKSKVVQAKIKFSQDASKKFNDILEDVTGIESEKTFSNAQAKLRGAKTKYKGLVPPSAQDFMGLMYNFLGKGKKGDKQMAFFKEHLVDPFARGINEINSARQNTYEDYKKLRKKFPKIKGKLNKKVGDTGFTNDHAIRIYLWNKAGFSIPGLSKKDLEMLVKHVKGDVEMRAFADGLGKLSKTEIGYSKPGKYWVVENIASDLLSDGAIGDARAEFLSEWIKNKNQIFSEQNLNKIEAIYGSKFREALEDILYRMETGKNRPVGGNRLTNMYMNWVNNSVGAIMFFNIRSASLQTISAINYVNWTDNNPLKAGLAFANQPQFWKDFVYLFNSDFLKQRRTGNRRGINEQELTEAIAGSNNKAKAALAWLLKKGFLPTQIADSFAIASGGATFYRNRIKTYIKQGMSKVDAEKQAFLDFQETTEVSQQSARPDLISQQQANPLGRLILSFQNTPMQYGRIMNKAFRDLYNRRGDDKTNISKIVYYGGIQAIIFNALQSAIWAALADDDEEEVNKKEVRILNGMIDSWMSTFGYGGKAISTIKNTYLEYIKQKAKDLDDNWYTDSDHTYTLLQVLSFSPPIGSKLRKIYSAIQTEKFNKEVFGKMELRIDNPVWNAVGNVVEGITNIPLGRLSQKLLNLDNAMDSNLETWKRVALMMGWNTWDLGIRDSDVEKVKEIIKEEKKEEKKIKKKEKEKIKKEEKEKENIKKEEDNKKLQEKEKKENKEVKCAAINKSGNRCNNKIEPGSSYCTIHAKVEKRTDGKKAQCKKIKSNKERCKMQTSAKSGYCYYHD